MKKLLAIPVLLLPATLLLPACSREDVQAKTRAAAEAAQDSIAKVKEAVANLDVSALSPEAMQTKVGEWTGALATRLADVKDAVSAGKLQELAQPYLDGLAKLKTALGDKMPSMESLRGAADDLKQRFADDPTVQKVLQPILDRIQTLLK